MSEAPADVEIDDPDNYSSSERLKHIYQARRQLREMRTEASSHRTSYPKKAVSHYRSGVESYLLELDTLMRRHPPGPEILYERDFGSVKIIPPRGWDKKHGYYQHPELGDKNSSLKVKSLPEPKEIALEGLISLLNQPTPLKHTFEFERWSNSLDGETVRVTQTAHISWETLNWMVSSMNEFMSDLGLGLDIDEQDEWKI